MARFLVKASEFKNVCKAVNDRKLAELKKEIIEILKKQDEKEVKKAIDYFNSQELHYTHLEKSFTGKWVEKAGYGVGTVRIWKGKKYKKIAPGKWARVFDKEGRGTNIAIGKLIARVQKIDNVEDLMAFVMANKQRFVDENGIDLPILDKLRAAVDARNGNVGSKGTQIAARKQLIELEKKRRSQKDSLDDNSVRLEQAKLLKDAGFDSRKDFDNFLKKEMPTENDVAEENYNKFVEEKQQVMKDPKTRLLQLADAVRNSTEGSNEYYSALNAFQIERDKFIESQGKDEYKKIMPEYPKGKKATEKDPEIKENDKIIQEEINKFKEILGDEDISLDRLEQMKNRQEIHIKNETEDNEGSRGRKKIAEEKLKIINQKIKEQSEKESEADKQVKDEKKIIENNPKSIEGMEFVNKNKMHVLANFLANHDNVNMATAVIRLQAAYEKLGEEKFLAHFPKDVVERYRKEAGKEESKKESFTPISKDKMKSMSDDELKEYEAKLEKDLLNSNRNDSDYMDKYNHWREVHGENNDRFHQRIEDEARAEKQAEADAKSAKEKEIKEKYHGYFDSRSGLDKARDLKTLENKYNFDGKVMSSKEFVEQAMDNGVEIKEREVNKLDYPSRTRWNRMNGYEQDEYEKRIKAAGKKTVYSIDGYEFPKTVVAYAKFYKEKKGNVKKSAFDDFVMDMFIDEDEEIEDAIKTDESLFNDYSAEQPELFNSTSMMVQEAFNRCNAL